MPLSAIRDAADSIYGPAVRTPLIRLDVPGQPAIDLYLKLELLQPIGSFKIRGAYNAIRQLSPAELRDGVWTVSAGNAAQGVALAAREVGARASVMVMDTAPDTKIRAIERLGASIVRATYDECWRTVESHGSDRMRGHFVHPFDDDRFIAGNATLALEIFEDLPDVDAIVAPIGGGGLLAGIAAAVAGVKPGTRVYAAEPATAAPLATSLAAGRPVYFRRMDGVVCRRRRRQVRAADDVADAQRSRRIHRGVARRCGGGDEIRRRARASHRRGRGRMRGRRGPQRRRRPR